MYAHPGAPPARDRSRSTRIGDVKDAQPDKIAGRAIAAAMTFAVGNHSPVHDPHFARLQTGGNIDLRNNARGPRSLDSNHGGTERCLNMAENGVIARDDDLPAVGAVGPCDPPHTFALGHVPS